METVQTIQQLAPASTAVALLALPWIAVLFMHAVSAVTDAALDDEWSNRAGAAIRWAGAVLDPAGPRANTTIQFTKYRAAGSSKAGRARFGDPLAHAA